jgi:hypothetical protein
MMQHPHSKALQQAASSSCDWPQEEEATRVTQRIIHAPKNRISVAIMKRWFVCWPLLAKVSIYDDTLALGEKRVESELRPTPLPAQRPPPYILYCGFVVLDSGCFSTTTWKAGIAPRFGNEKYTYFPLCFLKTFL